MESMMIMIEVLCIYIYSFSVLDCVTSSISGDSGFDSQGGCIMTPWPNGKAPDYGYFSRFDYV